MCAGEYTWEGRGLPERNGQIDDCNETLEVAYPRESVNLWTIDGKAILQNYRLDKREPRGCGLLPNPVPRRPRPFAVVPSQS